MHNPSGGPAPDFISINSGDFPGNRPGKSHRGGRSTRGYYGPPKSPRGIAPGRSVNSETPNSFQQRSKRKREAQSGDRLLEFEENQDGEHFKSNGVTTEAVKHSGSQNPDWGSQDPNLRVQRMPWHPPNLERYPPGIIG